jgi:GAF domain-containing protein
VSDAAAGSGRLRPPTEVLDPDTLDQLLRTVVSLAQATVGSADGVSVSLAANGGFVTPSATDDVVRELDSVQYQERSGPCVEAIDTGKRFAIALAASGERYPRFAAAAQQRFMTGVVSTPLATDEGAFGALNCYSASAERFPPGDLDVASQIAGHASALLAGAATRSSATTTNEQLQAALLSRDLIGQAKGILMERHRCSAEEAFDLLRRTSQRENRKLTAIAQDVVDARRPDALG